MKKQNLLKLAFFAMAMMIFSGSYAQNPGSILDDYEDVAETIYQTVNVGLTLYVAPDPVYHPDYVTAYVGGDSPLNAGLNGISEWRWMHTAWDAGDDTNLQKDWSTENWVVLPGGDVPAAGATKTFKNINF